MSNDPIAQQTLAHARQGASGEGPEERIRSSRRRAIGVPAGAGVVAAAVVVIVSAVSDGVGALGIVIAGVLAVSASLYAYLAR
jgi:hypothetical protein